MKPSVRLASARRGGRGARPRSQDVQGAWRACGRHETQQQQCLRKAETFDGLRVDRAAGLVTITPPVERDGRRR